MKDIIKKVAEQHGISSKECREEMVAALQMAGLEIEPEPFIALCIALLYEHSEDFSKGAN